MQSRKFLSLTLVLGVAASCRTVQRAMGLGGSGGSRTTSVFGQWVLATPLDSTSFAGASQVELTLAPGSFTLMAVYPGRSPLNVTGRADVTGGGTLTLVPTTGAADATAIGFPPGQPFTRVASASGATLVLAAPTSSVPVPSSVWYRLDAAKIAGLAR
jgi:hypothetical protein